MNKLTSAFFASGSHIPDPALPFLTTTPPPPPSPSPLTHRLAITESVTSCSAEANKQIRSGAARPRIPRLETRQRRRGAGGGTGGEWVCGARIRTESEPFAGLPESHLHLQRGHNGLLQRTVHPHLHLHFTAGQFSVTLRLLGLHVSWQV